MNLSYCPARLEIKSVSGSTFSGYGSVFDVKDLGDDVMAPGCFSDSLASHAKNGSMPKMLWQHNPREPCGKYTSLKEDSRGLHVDGVLMKGTPIGDYAYAALKMKAVEGLSIGFKTRDDSYDQKTGIRTVKKADLWEVSIVTFPMNEAARVDQVKSIPEFEGVSEFERFLRDAANLSRSEAGAVVAKARTLFQRDAVNTERSKQAILNALARRAATFGA